ncbi:MAG: hypothetical protein QF513_00145 [Gammaproteobacteria bacterium]|nr:hypothetical protein [Gammaproteobacteria bacterium]MDP6146190.1 hypothetical protein [Gammaproteobacteria bacterium]HJL79702.1 hypothetical protein [Gammaproteobacteria bacterium]HJN00156.1 hypothetical protein [Gammaproteobacteria bacterium]
MPFFFEYLQSEKSGVGLIALFEINSNKFDKNEPIHNPSIQFGQSVIVLNTNDHQKIYEELKEKDYVFSVEPTEYLKKRSQRQYKSRSL